MENIIENNELIGKFIYKGEYYRLHFDADEYGVYGISKDTDETITFVNKLKHRYNKEYKQAYQYALKQKLDKHPIADEQWASRRWNRELTDYIDLSS